MQQYDSISYNIILLGMDYVLYRHVVDIVFQYLHNGLKFIRIQFV